MVSVPAGAEQGSPSLFELPVSRGARITRIATVLFLDLLLAGGGVILFVAYLQKRAEAAATTAPMRTKVDGSGSARGSGEDVQPETVRSTAADDDSSKPANGADKPSTDKPSTDTPSTDKPSTDKPSADTPSTDTPSADTPSADTPSADTPSADKPSTDTPSTDTPSTDTPGTDTPSTDTPPSDELGEHPTEQERVRILTAKIGVLVQRSDAQLQRCYERAAKSGRPDEPLTGRIDVQFSVHPDGKAREVRAITNTSGSQVLAKCLVGLVDTWTFPSSGDTPMDFVWPFEFKAPR